MKNIILEHVKSFLNENNFNSSIAEVLNIKDYKFGHFSTNFLMKLGKQKIETEEIFNKFKLFISKFNDIYDSDKIELTNNGYLNITLTKNFIKKQINELFDKNDKLIINNLKGKINYEFVSANPTGYLHVGHARNAIVGDINCRVMEFLGYEVIREYYINDAGNQINDLFNSVKWYLENDDNKIPVPKEIPYKGSEIKICANDFKKEYSNEINMELEQDKIKEWLKNYFLNQIKEILAKIKVKDFGIFTSEKSLSSIESNYINKTIDLLNAKKMLIEKDGATWLKSTNFGDDKDRVLIKSTGEFTYVLGDIAFHIKKFEENYDQLFNLWGTDHKGYEKRIVAALDSLNFDSKKLRFDFINMVQISNDGDLIKMSKRLGTSYTIVDILKKMNSDLLRFFIVSKNKEQSLDIDISQSIKTDMSNPYWYNQYAYARINQILLKKPEWTKLDVENFDNLCSDKKEENLVLKILEIREVIFQAYKNQEPHIFVNYLKELSNYFHSYYNFIVVISDEKKHSIEKLKLMKILSKTYETVFDLLGITPLKKM